MIQAVAVVAPTVVARLVPFALNTLVLARTPAQDLGMATQVELVVAAGLEVLRDPLRLVVTSNRQLAVNLSYMSMTAYLAVIPPLLWGLFGFNSNVAILLLAHVLELAFEPYLLISQYIQLEFGRRSTLESLASIAKCLLQTYVALSTNDYVLGFSLGELIYSLVLLFGYILFFKGEILLPRRYSVKDKLMFVDRDTWSHYKSSLAQQLVKLFLSQGDKFLVSTLLPLEDQGYYALVDNYASLVPRLVFAPLEETTRINVKAQLEKKEPINVKTTVDIYAYLLPLLALFGPLNINFLIKALLQRQLPPQALTAFPLYLLSLPLLGINGILEAITTVTSKSETDKHSLFMVFSAIVFYATMVFFVSSLNWGLGGFILANMVNSALRIVWNFAHVSKFVAFSPPLLFMATVVLVGALQLSAFGTQVTDWYQFGLSALCGAVCVACAFFTIWRKSKPTLSSKPKTA